MGEVDYQIALLLQHQFEQELKSTKECNSDLELAKNLQEQFQREADIEKPKQNLVYNEKGIKNPSKSLTDPSWEVVDPTPDIHVLFMAFNDRFFWNKLLAVCVSWSKRMTSCAGICSYQGKGGLCSITLSEPLLKLRPRKDLVETLLHEMIHAFLFVTDNNRDRDGHGPEFHKHMYRINAEAGTNITVYHDFHDEVRLYKQHWWRCDGPCQKWKPYFGMVRRAMNRAPGPQDRWWGEHSRNCGGNFIKVKEPEKPQKKPSKASAKENTNPKEDIRKFLPTQANTSKINVPPSTTVLSNVHTITNKNNTSEISAVIPSKVSNIFGFTNLNGGKTSNGGPSSNKVRGAVKNNSNTIVINKTQNGSKTSNTNTQSKQNDVTTNAQGRTLTTTINDTFDYSTVRNHWLNKFSNDSSRQSVKRKLPEDSSNKQSKIQKSSRNARSPNNAIKNEDTAEAECPICMKKMLLILLNAHVDECLQTPNKHSEKECILCGDKIHVNEYEKHMAICTEKKIDDDVFENPQETECTKCSFCGKSISTKSYDNHLAICLRDFVDNIDKPNDNVIDLTDDDDKLEEKHCAACDTMITVSSYDSHVEKCLLKMYDKIETDYGYENKEVLIGEEEKIDCLACGNKILKSELGLHLEDCMSLSAVFDDDNEPKEITKDCDKEENKYNCPFCMRLVSEVEMNSHIDICLNIKDNSLEIERDKSILVGSLSSSDDFEL